MEHLPPSELRFLKSDIWFGNPDFFKQQTNKKLTLNDPWKKSYPCKKSSEMLEI
jgi:hypothetical protein